MAWKASVCFFAHYGTRRKKRQADVVVTVSEGRTSHRSLGNILPVTWDASSPFWIPSWPSWVVAVWVEGLPPHSGGPGCHLMATPAPYQSYPSISGHLHYVPLRFSTRSRYIRHDKITIDWLLKKIPGPPASPITSCVPGLGFQAVSGLRLLKYEGVTKMPVSRSFTGTAHTLCCCVFTLAASETALCCADDHPPDQNLSSQSDRATAHCSETMCQKACKSMLPPTCEQWLPIII